MCLRVKRKLNLKDGQGAFQYLPFRVFGVAGDKKSSNSIGGNQADKSGL